MTKKTKKTKTKINKIPNRRSRATVLKPQSMKNPFGRRSRATVLKPQSMKNPSQVKVVKTTTRKARVSKTPELPDEEMKDETKPTKVFFKKEIVENFQTKLGGKIKIKDNDLKLYTIEDILNFVKQKKENEEEKDLIKKIIDFLVENDICKGSIEKEYLGVSLANGINRAHNHDIAFIANTSIEKTFLLTNIVGFIVVEFGECKSYPFAYSIKLICGSGTGSFLMGLYLYTILSYHDKKDEVKLQKKDLAISHIGVLELADAYTNPGGLCMYEKFGFAYDHTMTNPDCFDDVANLPMILKIQEKYKDCNNIEGIQQCIIDITLGTTTIFGKSKICGVKDARQMALGILKNTKIYLEKKKIPRFNKENYTEKPLYDLLVRYNNEKKILFILVTMIAFFENPDGFKSSDGLSDDGKKLYDAIMISFDDIVVDAVNKQKNKKKDKKNIIAECIVKIFIGVFPEPKKPPRESSRLSLRYTKERGKEMTV